MEIHYNKEVFLGEGSGLLQPLQGMDLDGVIVVYLSDKAVPERLENWDHDNAGTQSDKIYGNKGRINL